MQGVLVTVKTMMRQLTGGIMATRPSTPSFLGFSSLNYEKATTLGCGNTKAKRRRRSFS